jgi:hypothetical protein
MRHGVADSPNREARGPERHGPSPPSASRPSWAPWPGSCLPSTPPEWTRSRPCATSDRDDDHVVADAAPGPGSSCSRIRAETIRVIAHVGQPARTLSAGSGGLMSPEVGGGVARGPGRSPQRRNTNTGQRGAPCNREHPYTQAWSASFSMPARPPHRGERHGQKEGQEGSEGQEGQEGSEGQEAAVRAPAAAETAVAPSASPRPKKS